MRQVDGVWYQRYLVLPRLTWSVQYPESLDAAAARPLTPYWGDISTALQQKFSPPSSVDQSTPAKAQAFILKVLNGKALL